VFAELAPPRATAPTPSASTPSLRRPTLPDGMPAAATPSSPHRAASSTRSQWDKQRRIVGRVNCFIMQVRRSAIYLVSARRESRRRRGAIGSIAAGVRRLPCETGWLDSTSGVWPRRWSESMAGGGGGHYPGPPAGQPIPVLPYWDCPSCEL
jgi:hypothetical protein